MNEVDFYLKDLKSRFPKDTKNYYLSYSGGRDSHFLYWFIKEYLKNNDIEIVGLNTYMEHHEILKRILKNSDVILLPKMKPFEIKEKYGIPCFSKEQDQMIYGYQKAVQENRQVPKTYYQKVHGTYKTRSISKKAREYVLSSNAHKITHLCCYYLKKLPFHEYEQKTGKKAILGVRASESQLRKQQYKSCFSKNGKFHPLYDLTNEMLKKIEKQHTIEVPNIYNYISRTGCISCPYGSYKNECTIELELVNENRKNYIIKLFKESYDILNVNYNQLNIFDFIKGEK